MISLSSDITNVQQISLEYQSVKSNNEVTKNETTQSTEQTTPSTQAEISKLALSQINEVISKEDSLIQNYTSAQNIYNSLGNIRLQLAVYIQSLNNTEDEFTIESLEELEARSNSLIENVINVLNDNNAASLIGSEHLNLYFSRLNSLKNLKIRDDNFFTKLESIKSNVKQEEETFQNIADETYSELEQVSSDYEKIPQDKDSEKNKEVTDSKTLQNKIVTEIEETLKSTASNLTPEIVLRLLNQG